METLFRYTAPLSKCGYLPTQRWSLEYEMVANLSAREYAVLLEAGWRRFGGMLFHPACPACQACQSLRVDVAGFQPNRSQRRAWQANSADVKVRIGAPSVSRAKLEMYDRFHAFHTENQGWPEHPAKDADSYRESFVNNPDFTEEWCFYLEDQLIGVGYADRLEDSMSAIYFFYEPDLRGRSLGTYNVLCLLKRCAQLRLTHLYLGYYVAGCRSLEYKANFKPNQVRYPDGSWRDFFSAPRE
ncbi:MAG: arginyltransferase [Planctomycetes bacterium]|nr:arginyltransferase [Planctomycetota bacterium]